MRSQIFNFFRHTKRKLLTGGFAETVYLFLKELQQEENAFHHHEGDYVVDLSFDLELGFNTPFWEGDLRKALAYGTSARNKFLSILGYLRKERIPSNVQIAGLLMNEDLATLSLFSPAQREAIRSHRELFALSHEDMAMLTSPDIEAGIHGFSHRHFTELSSQDADYEMRNAVRVFEKKFGKAPEFMSFPKNYIAHTDVVKKHGVKCWRADRQHPATDFEIPLGLWFAPGVLGASDLGRLLAKIKESRTGYFLHLWGHCTEMDVRVFAELLHVIKRAGWGFTTVKNFKRY